MKVESHKVESHKVVKFVDRKELDVGKWDRLMAEAREEALYPYSW